MNSSRPAVIRTIITGFVVLFSLAFAASAMAAEYVSVRKNGVNVRSGPSTTNEVRWEVFKGFPLEVLKHENGWANCRDFEGDVGWIHEDLLTARKTVIVRKKKINLRSVPNTGPDSRILAVVKYGVVFEAVAAESDWLNVRHEDGTQGWVHKDLVWPADPLN